MTTEEFTQDNSTMLTKLQQAIRLREAELDLLRDIIAPDQIAQSEATLSTLRQKEAEIRATLSGSGAIAQGGGDAVAATGGKSVAIEPVQNIEEQRALMKRFADFIESTETNSAYIEQGQELLQKIRAQGRYLADPDKRGQFIDMARKINERLFDLTSEYYSARLEEFIEVDQYPHQVVTQYNTASTVTAGGNVSIIYQGSPPPPSLDPATALGRYLAHVIESNRRLQLQGIRSAGQLVSIELEQVYITLTATTRHRTPAEKDSWLADVAEMTPGERHRRQTQPRDAAGVVKVQQALADYPRLVVVGDPGSGKTTLLRYLALTYARDLSGEEGLVQRRLNLDKQRLPILLPLREFARYLAAHHPDVSLDGPRLLLDYLRTYFANQDILLPERFFADRLQQGRCAVLLDGVDEVANLETRHRIARIIERFTVAYPDNRTVVTSRLVGYSGPARLGEGYTVTRICDFSDGDIRNFVSHWNLAVELTLAQADTTEVHRQAQQQTEMLLTAIRYNEWIRQLTVNPLLLTVIALVQRYRAQLPQRRTELYEEAIEVLLGQWDAAKGLAGTITLAGRELDAGDRRSLLEPIALWMMEQQLREIETDDLRQQLDRQFLAMLNNRRVVDKAVEGFIRLISERSGLLNERGRGVYSFSHITFQEYLAARAVADRDDYLEYTLARMDDRWWREVILLEAGYLSTQGKRRVTELIKAIVDHESGSGSHHNLFIGAECIIDVGQARVLGSLGSDLSRRLVELLTDYNTATISKIRVSAGDYLAKLSDPRPGVIMVDAMQFCHIPPGPFWMGSENDDPQAYDDEKPQHQFDIPYGYWLARYPVTVAQWLEFVKASGYTSERNDSLVDLPNRPVRYITWYEAVRFCEWLTQRWKSSGLLPSGWQVQLPSEPEWEKAAKGGLEIPVQPLVADVGAIGQSSLQEIKTLPNSSPRRYYPWGDDISPDRANYEETGIGMTSAVGCFPGGTSPYGTQEMSGNIWEWTATKWQDNYKGYRNDNSIAETNDFRVLRGGAFFSEAKGIRCAVRLRNGPVDRIINIGFRVSISSFQKL